MANSEFEAHYGKKVGIQYRGTIRWSNTAYDMRLEEDTVCTGIEGILERESENFVFLKDATPVATSVLFRSGSDDMVGKMDAKQNYYVNKRDILQMYVFGEKGEENAT